MSAAAVLDHTYLYPFASKVTQHDSGVGLQLATCGAQHDHPHFFEGSLRHPRQFGEMLLVLSDVVRTHFFLPQPALLDPVVTTHEEVVRFEGFSGCCGVYVRVDLMASAFDAELAGRGTTNVDFNNPMRASLAKLRQNDSAQLSVGRDAVELSRGDESVVEKKVKLPTRWLKGFSEVQAYQPGLEPVLEVSGIEARRFVRSLSRTGGPKRPVFLTKRGRGLSTTHRGGPGTVAVQGIHRVKVLEPLLNSALGLTIWAGDNGVSAWVIDVEEGRLLLLLSPELYRGFSGEGQALDRLAVGEYESVLPAIRAQLSWQPQIKPMELATKAGCSEEAAIAGLAALGSRGLAGYDITTGCYFHREMPFDLGAVEKLQPRLIAARKLMAAGAIKPEKSGGSDEIVFYVQGTGVSHRVALTDQGDRCTCPWFAKHQGTRGPCKHVLAAKLHHGEIEFEEDTQ